MLLDIRKIFSSYDAPIVHTLALDLSEESFRGYTVDEPVQGKLTAVLQTGVLQLDLQIFAIVNAQCARCLDPVQQKFDFERTFLIREDDWAQEDPELPFTPGGKLDVKELVYTELILEVPMVLLCKDSCKGLCPVC